LTRRLFPLDLSSIKKRKPLPPAAAALPFLISVIMSSLVSGGGECEVTDRWCDIDSKPVELTKAFERSI
jgi:hypothetical protein